MQELQKREWSSIQMERTVPKTAIAQRKNKNVSRKNVSWFNVHTNSDWLKFARQQKLIISLLDSFVIWNGDTCVTDGGKCTENRVCEAGHCLQTGIEQEFAS